MTKNKISKNILCILMMICLIKIAYSTGTPYTPNPAQDYLVDGYDSLPFKDQRGDESWSSNINSNYNPDRNWDTDFSDNDYDAISFKCLSYATSTTNDWFNIQYGVPMRPYKSIINGENEEGTNPRLLEAKYHESIDNIYYAYTPWYSFVAGAYWDDITYERVPYRLNGFADILVNQPLNWINHDDPKLSNPQEFNYTYEEDVHNIGEFIEIPISLEGYRGTEDENNLILALHKYGALLSFTENTGSKLNVHSMALVGYGNDGDVFFIAHDNYGAGGSGGYSEYKKLYIEDIDQAFAFLPNKEWPTFHHDNRRTGFTLLKGEIEDEDDVEKLNLVLHKEVTIDTISRASIAHLDDNGRMDIVVSASKSSSDGWLYRIESNRRGTKLRKRGIYDVGEPITAPPSLADTYGDDNNGVYVL